ncbi:MAG TPA: L-seryl-tRNA(Sec) selenium transferase, partial [Caldilineaceae bacterium]|nr:L-seryl-tRNA(Sec) selenium transferase [Caldilineaceae bacterium]
MPSRRSEIDHQSEYRKLPSIDALLNEPAIHGVAALYGREALATTLRALLTDARQAIAAGNPAPQSAQWPQLVADRLEQHAQPSLRPLVNATGVIIHTNLGRAPLSQNALSAVAQLGAGYSNLEYDLMLGERGSRYDHARRLLQELTGAED